MCIKSLDKLNVLQETINVRRYDNFNIDWMPMIDTKKPAEVINNIFFNVSCVSNTYVAFGAFCKSITSIIFTHDKLT